MLNKKLLPFTLFGFFVCLYSKVEGQSQVSTRHDSTYVNIHSDSLLDQKALNDPRRTFRDLFVSSPEKMDNYSVQLNPRAISFVQDYMAIHTRQLEQIDRK